MIVNATVPGGGRPTPHGSVIEIAAGRTGAVGGMASGMTGTELDALVTGMMMSMGEERIIHARMLMLR